jgi:hypothetical protein
MSHACAESLCFFSTSLPCTYRATSCAPHQAACLLHAVSLTLDCHNFEWWMHWLDELSLYACCGNLLTCHVPCCLLSGALPLWCHRCADARACCCDAFWQSCCTDWCQDVPLHQGLCCQWNQHHRCAGEPPSILCEGETTVDSCS